MTQAPMSDFDKIGLTAFGASLSRQFTDLPYAKKLAQLVESQRLVGQNDPAYLEQVKRGTAFTGRSPDHDFQTIDQARQFADEQGFHVAEYGVLDVINQLSCLGILDIDIAVARKMLTEQYVFAMTLDVT